MAKMIEVCNLSKKYARAKEFSVSDVSFDVDEGEFFAFLGPNGAGKTTTISILTTTLSMTEGSVKIAGYDVMKESQKVRNNVGIIFQKPSLDQNLTAEQNIRFHACLYGMYTYSPTFSLMPESYKKRVYELSEVVGIQDSLFKPIKKLSGGMQRKLEIIRSLVHTPKVLFLDEPTQGLDAVSRRGLWDYIDGVRKEYGTTVFLTTHYIDEAENVDKVAIIKKGQIAIQGSPEEMKNSLLRHEVVLDADDRYGLVFELTEMGLRPQVGENIIVPCGNLSPQKIISGLTTELSVLKIKEPTLEDAYVEYIGSSFSETENDTEAEGGAAA
ncbi:MAG: ABC transporter ATP-binding protein [Clostridiales Family XIII bacterium]|jgi:ABC-2 type transport system ATP-binding protein|nr:ABC transporter ATP-binding protein [Clostridiales Family XIII bacterium]